MCSLLITVIIIVNLYSISAVTQSLVKWTKSFNFLADYCVVAREIFVAAYLFNSKDNNTDILVPRNGSAPSYYTPSINKSHD